MSRTWVCHAICALMLLCPLAGRVACAEPLRLSFEADRDLAGVGERVHWTVWATLPADESLLADILAVTADFVPRGGFGDSSVGRAEQPVPLMYAEHARPEVRGMTINGVELSMLLRDGAPFVPRRVPLYSFVTEITTLDRAAVYDADATVIVARPSGLAFFSRLDGAAHFGGRIDVDSDIVNRVGCGPADIAEPWGVLNTADLSRFLGLYQAGAAYTDLAAPFGTVDFNDFVFFMDLYLEGCGFIPE